MGTSVLGRFLIGRLCSGRKLKDSLSSSIVRIRFAELLVTLGTGPESPCARKVSSSSWRKR